MDLINTQVGNPTLDELRGQWLLLAGQCGQALEAWRALWLTYVDPTLDLSEYSRTQARELQARAWTEYVAVSAQADRAWHDYDRASLIR